MQLLALSPSHPSPAWPAVLLLRYSTPSALSHPTLAASATPPAVVPAPQTPLRTAITVVIRLLQSPQVSPPRQMSLPPKWGQRRRSQAQQLLTQFRRKTSGQAQRRTSQLLTASFPA